MPPWPTRSACPSPSRFNVLSMTRPAIGRLKIPVATILPLCATSLGGETFTESSFILDSFSLHRIGRADVHMQLFWLGHRKDLFPGKLHIVDLARVLLHVGHQLVVGLSPDHVSAVAVHELCHWCRLLSWTYTTPRLLRGCWQRVVRRLVGCR